MRETWFTSDQHFGHARIICYRPFSSAEEMDEALIENWNSRIKPNDFVYHLGDVAFTPAERYLSRLNGKIHLIAGNHDDVTRLSESFIWVKDYYFFKLDKKEIALSHYPFSSWRNSSHGSYHLHGHTHDGAYTEARRLDVGVDCNRYQPWSWEEVKNELEQHQILERI